jgi:hypothetical protein
MEMWEMENLEFKKGSFHYEASKPYRLWYEYLRLSPTYLLAHKERNTKDGLTEDELKNLPNDFDEVRRTYDAFGNVYKEPFRSWWVWHGAKLFGLPSSKLQAKRLAFVPSDREVNKEVCLNGINEYISRTNPSYMLMSVPLTGSRSEILKAVSKQLDDAFLCPLQAQYSLSGERFHHEALSIGLRLLWMKGRESDLTIWRLGVKAKVSSDPKYRNLDVDCKKLDAKMRELTPVLTTLTSRTLKQAKLVMENAARGKFPCKDDIPLPTINYEMMSELAGIRLKANTRNAKNMLDSILSGALIPIGIAEDWEDDLLLIKPEYKLKIEERKANITQHFLEQQLKLHQLKKRS